MKLTVVLPCYNEEENIARIPEILLPELSALSCDYEILLIDDGSTDRSVEVARSFAIPQLKIIQHERNKGIGAAVKTAILAASGDLLVTLDTDFTFHPRYIKDLLERYNAGDVDFVIGSPRLASFGKNIQKYRVFISIAANMVYSALLGKKVTAVSPIFRLYKTSQLKELQIETDGFDISVEILFRLILTGCKFAEMPTPLGLRQFGVSKLDYKKEIIRHLFLIRRIIVWRIKNILRKCLNKIFTTHRAATIVAVLVGLIYFLPNILIPAMQDQSGFGTYHPLSLEAPTLDEVAAYGSRLREVMDGHFADGDAYLAEYKNKPTMWGSDVMAIALGFIPFILRLNDPTLIFVIGDLFFPAFIFLAAYALFFFITKHKHWSIFGALIFSVFPNISVFRSFFSPSFYGNFSLFGVFAVFSRSFDSALTRLFVPGFSLIFFILFLLATLRALRGKKGKNKFFPLPLAAILAFGSLFYVYFYYWAFATVLMLVLTSLLLFFNREKAFTALKILFGGLVISLPYWFKVLSLRANPFYDELATRVGLEYSRNFRTGSIDAYILAIFLFLLLLWLGKKRGEIVTSIFLGAALLSYIVVLNIQIVTGFNIQPDHWGSRVNVYILSLGIMVVAFWLFDFLSKKFKNSRPIISAPIIYVLVWFFLSISLIVQIRNSSLSSNDYRIPEDLLVAYKWINLNTPKDSVFLSPSSKTTFYLPFFTHANVYAPPSCYSLLPRDQIIDRFLEAYAAFGVKEDFLRKSLEANLGDGIGIEYARGAELDPIYMLFCDSYASYKPGGYISGGSLRPFPVEVLNELMAKYKDKLDYFKKEKAPFRDGFKDGVDYVFWGPHERLIGKFNPRKYKNLRLIFSQNLVEIYELLP